MLGTCNSPNPASKKRLVSCCSCSAAGILFCWAEPGRGGVSKPVLGWGGGRGGGQSRDEHGWAGLGWVLGGSWAPKGTEDDTRIQEDGAEFLVPLTCCVTPGCRSPSLCLRRCPTSPRRNRAQEVRAVSGGFSGV